MTSPLRRDAEKYRRWVLGLEGVTSSVRWRVERGGKSPHDLVLEWWLDGRWVRIGMDITFLAADFMYENESVLYPPPARGGQMYFNRLRTAIKDGWETAGAILEHEKVGREPPFGTDDEYWAVRDRLDLGPQCDVCGGALAAGQKGRHHSCGGRP